MDLDTMCRAAENELLAWIGGTRSNTNIIGGFYGADQIGERHIAIERADAATIERLTASLKALYVIREGRKP